MFLYINLSFLFSEPGSWAFTSSWPPCGGRGWIGWPREAERCRKTFYCRRYRNTQGFYAQLSMCLALQRLELTTWCAQLYFISICCEKHSYFLWLDSCDTRLISYAWHCQRFDAVVVRVQHPPVMFRLVRLSWTAYTMWPSFFDIKCTSWNVSNVNKKFIFKVNECIQNHRKIRIDSFLNLFTT